MKPCKGCKYLDDVLFGPYCNYGVWPIFESYVDPITGQQKRRRRSKVKAEFMRSAGGECGPDRRLYDTNWRVFKRWICRKIKSGLTNDDQTA